MLYNTDTDTKHKREATANLAPVLWAVGGGGTLSYELIPFKRLRHQNKAIMDNFMASGRGYHITEITAATAVAATAATNTGTHYTRVGAFVRWGMAVTNNRHKLIAVWLLKQRLCNGRHGRFGSKTAARRLQK
jgi:hypothetical protein